MLLAAADDQERQQRHERMVQAATQLWTLAYREIRVALERKRWRLNACVIALCCALSTAICN